MKTQFFDFDYAEPHPILSKNSERRVQRQMKNAVFDLTMPSRILFYSKIVKGERRTKFQFIVIHTPSPRSLASTIRRFNRFT